MKWLGNETWGWVTFRLCIGITFIMGTLSSSNRRWRDLCSWRETKLHPHPWHWFIFPLAVIIGYHVLRVLYYHSQWGDYTTSVSAFTISSMWLACDQNVISVWSNCNRLPWTSTIMRVLRVLYYHSRQGTSWPSQSTPLSPVELGYWWSADH